MSKHVHQNPLLGLRRVTEADTWDRSFLDLVGLATITFRETGEGDLRCGALNATLDLEFSRSIIFFKLHGCDEVTGSGLAEMGDDGRLAIETAFD